MSRHERQKMEFEAIHFAELLDFRLGDGSIWLKNERVLVRSASSIGMLRRDLIANFGMEAARRVIQRMAYAQGYLQGLIMSERYGTKVAVPSGPIIFGLEGLGSVTVIVKIKDPKRPDFHEEGIIHGSPDAEQHMLLFGKSDMPVCWTATGFASGYHTAARGKLLYFEEETCVAMGNPYCHIVAREIKGAPGQNEHTDPFAGESPTAVDIFRDVREEMDLRFRSLHKKGGKAKPHSSRPGKKDTDGRRDVVERAIALPGESRFIVSDRAMSEAVREAVRVAPLPTSVLVQGESGTGKEFFAHLIHHSSGYTQSPFVSLNCAALTESLLESELFGHVRGAFTGAIRDKAGLLEIARDGTLFLDEVGDMPLSVQAKLLRALELRQIRRVGGEADVKIHARIVAATNIDLASAIDAGRFRPELYFRLAGFVIHLPALRERREAIPILAYEFLNRAAPAFGKNVVSISPEVMNRLTGYSWPGNVRELKHAIERAVIISNGSEIEADALPKMDPHRIETPSDFDLKQSERNLILKALLESKGNRSIAARSLHIDPATLWRKLKRYNIEVPRQSRSKDTV
jgi:DNA-binding NtrC family response regulator